MAEGPLPAVFGRGTRLGITRPLLMPHAPPCNPPLPPAGGGGVCRGAGLRGQRLGGRRRHGAGGGGVRRGPAVVRVPFRDRQTAAGAGRERGGRQRGGARAQCAATHGRFLATLRLHLPLLAPSPCPRRCPNANPALRPVPPPKLADCCASARRAGQQHKAPPLLAAPGLYCTALLCMHAFMRACRRARMKRCTRASDTGPPGAPLKKLYKHG